MWSRSPWWAKLSALHLLIFWSFLLFLQPVLALQSPGERSLPDLYPPGMEPEKLTHVAPKSSKNNDSTNHLLCTPFGACEPCPLEAMDEPFCQPFGNRRLMHCINGTFIRDPPQDTHPPPNEQSRRPSSASTLYPEGDLPAWESCGRIVPKERADFYEFVACNVAFATLALGVLFFRSRRMQVNQARQLAARIGLIRGDGGRIFRR